MNFDKNFGGVGHVTSNSWLDYSGDLDHNADTGFFKSNFYHCDAVQFYEFCDQSINNVCNA